MTIICSAENIKHFSHRGINKYRLIHIYVFIYKIYMNTDADLNAVSAIFPILEQNWKIKMASRILFRR